MNAIRMNPLHFHKQADCKRIHLAIVCSASHCVNYSIINELIHRQEPEYKLYEGMKDGITKCDAIIRNATKKFQNKSGHPLDMRRYMGVVEY